MKFNKLFFAAVAFATLAMVGCKKNGQNEPTPVPGPDEEEVPECPAIDAPGAGSTTIAIYAEVCPRGCYIVGNSTPAGWNEKDDQSLLIPVQGADNWYSVTIPFFDDLQIKAIARPSDEDVELGWSYQWGKNYDPNDPGDLDESVENTKILAGTGEFEYENQGQPKLIHVADNGVIYIWVKNWAASPVIEAKKLETAWVKSNFNNEDWAWYEMTAKGDGVFEFEGIWGGNGCNINETGTDDGAQWYANPELIDDPKAGDKVLVTFVSEKMAIGQLSIKLLEKGQHEVVPAGNGTFVVTVANRDYTDGDVCIFTGNFPEKGWADSDRAMTYDAGTKKWSWTGEYPEDFEYKVIYNGAWAAGNNVKFDGSNYEATFEIQ